MSRKVVRALALVGLLGWAVPAAAQSIPRQDASVLFGWSTAKRPRSGVPYDYWIGEWFTTATVGHYWSDHQKIEVTVAGGPERQLFGGYEYLEHSPLSYTNRSTTVTRRTQLFTGAHVYQFFRNQFVHPFVGAGLEVDRERSRSETTEETFVRASNLEPYELSTSTTTRTEPRTDFKVRIFGLAGLKGYVSERTFIRADISLSAGRAFDRVAWRIGGGFDF